MWFDENIFKNYADLRRNMVPSLLKISDKTKLEDW